MQVSSPGRVTPSKRYIDNDDDPSDYPSVIDLFDPYRPPRHPELKRVKREVGGKPFAITPPPPIDIPLLPSLYHLAASAHHASAQHLQQAFVPLNTSLPPTADIAPIRPRPDCLFQPDPAALDKATALLIFALDALRTGLAINSIAEKERVAFSIEFGHVAVKLLRAAPTCIDTERIQQDAREAVGVALSISRRFSYMRESMQQLEILDATLQAADGRCKAAARLIKQALASTPRSAEHSHRYTLRLLYADITSPTEALAMLDDLDSEARSNGHASITQLAALARLRLLFHGRHWLDVPDALASITPGSPSTWNTHLRLHHVLYQALWLGRSGDDAATRVCLKETYELMDLYISDPAVKQLKHTGGRYELRYTPTYIIAIQLTPPNVLFAMTYLATSVCRRDYLGSNHVAKSLIMPQMLQESAHLARADDLWDLDFTPSHGPAHALTVQREITTMRVEIMLEHVAALMYRCDNVQAEQVFSRAVHLAHEHDVFAPLAPHFTLVHAQFAHLLGRDQAALRSYRVCSSLVVPGSEFASIVEICALACAGAFVSTAHNSQMHVWVERCRPSSYACLSAAAHLVASFIDANRVAAKRKINYAYEISVKAGYNIIRLLVFTLTTSIHMFGNEDTRVRQLVSGLDSAKLMGGKGTRDEVGQLITGLWFAEKLKEHYRRENNVEAHTAAKLVQQRHLKRLHDQTHQVTSIPCNNT